jgi:hypothetical protein
MPTRAWTRDHRRACSGRCGAGWHPGRTARPVARSARVSPPPQPQEGTRASQGRSLRQHLPPQGGSRRPAPACLAAGIRGARRDRPALDRRREGAQRGACDAVAVLAPARRARDAAQRWFLRQEWTTLPRPMLCLPNPGGHPPQGPRRTPRHGRRGRGGARPEARTSAPWTAGERPARGIAAPGVSRRRVALSASPPRRGPPGGDCTGGRGGGAAPLRSVGRRGSAPPTPSHTPGRRAHTAPLRPPPGLASGPRLTTRVAAGQARDTARQLVGPSARKPAAGPRPSLTPVRRSRPATAGVCSEAPALISDEWGATAPGP